MGKERQGKIERRRIEERDFGHHLMCMSNQIGKLCNWKSREIRDQRSEGEGWEGGEGKSKERCNC